MSTMNSVVAVYNTHSQAEQAIKELQEAGVDMKSLSIAGKDTHTDEHVVGYYNTGDRMKRWGKLGAYPLPLLRAALSDHVRANHRDEDPEHTDICPHNPS